MPNRPRLPLLALALLASCTYRCAVPAFSYGASGRPSLVARAAGFSVGSSLTDLSLAYEAVGKFFTEKPDLAPTSGGVNNVGQYVTLPNGTRYVLRIYNNGMNRARVRWEHEILSQLNSQSLSFALPKALPDLAAGQPFTELSNGAEASVFEIIPGSLPKLTCAREIGAAAGELLQAIQNVKLDVPSPTPPYHDIYAVHHAVNRDLFFEKLRGPDFEGVRPAAQKAERLMLEMEELLAKFKAMGLPEILIHGDLHYDNVLVDDGKVSGLLDFEFAAIDWRAMELAVCLSKYCGEPDAIKYLDDFIIGFAKHGQLTMKEIQVVPDLINLRILSNVVYFVGRAIAKEDDISSITTRIETYCKRIEWVKSAAPAIIDRIVNELSKHGGLLTA